MGWVVLIFQLTFHSGHHVSFYQRLVCLSKWQTSTSHHYIPSLCISHWSTPTDHRHLNKRAFWLLRGMEVYEKCLRLLEILRFVNWKNKISKRPLKCFELENNEVKQWPEITILSLSATRITHCLRYALLIIGDLILKYNKRFVQASRYLLQTRCRAEYWNF